MQQGTRRKRVGMGRGREEVLYLEPKKQSIFLSLFFIM